MVCHSARAPDLQEQTDNEGYLMSANLGPIIKLLIGLFIFVGLPLISWGVTDLGGLAPWVY